MFDYRDYTAREILADGIIHGVAIAASLAAGGAVLALAAVYLEPGIRLALSVYAVTLVAMFSFSMAYNIIPHPSLKPLLRRFDQAAIFLKIAGTYTPLTILIGSVFSHAMLAVIWSGALVGVGLKIFGRMHRDRYTIPLYLALGWASVALVWPMMETLPTVDAVLIITGGLLYTVGLGFHVWHSLAYQNVIWHSFVLAAAACHFTAVSHASFTLGLAA
ncbi:PAQR family membrane homeostasis protein TrhA [Zhengella mangrovi]|uniref:PAQR family membrane homeostasis protein TrhA n=1 Tax=Zhengella mangrovi TaxID=1982044 RepID=UPI0013FD42BD|nr:hemolysin III family protein [Zhengella mangrovi]